MLLVLSSRRRLTDRYGEAGMARIERALAKLRGELTNRGPGARLVFPDDPLSMLALGLEPMDVSSGTGVRAALREIRGRLTADGSQVSAVLLVGGDGVVPFYRLPNPVADRSADPDPEVLTDNAYGLRQPDLLRSSLDDLVRPELPVGRVPDAEPAALEPFLTQLERLGEPPTPGRHGIFAVVDEAWVSAARSIVAGREAALRTSPAWHTGDGDWRQQQARLCYFNLHGFDDKPVWQGYGRRNGKWRVAVRPADITERESRGAVVFAENCYGALVTGRSAATSVALAFLAAGARAFVGATGLAFGSYVAPLTSSWLAHADLLARGFIDGALNGSFFGRALADARERFVGEGIGRPRGLTTTFEVKTALQFVLYGNPLATL